MDLYNPNLSMQTECRSGITLVELPKAVHKALEVSRIPSIHNYHTSEHDTDDLERTFTLCRVGRIQFKAKSSRRIWSC